MPEVDAREFRLFRSKEARERYLAHYEAIEKSWPVDSEHRTVRTDRGMTFMRISGPADGPALALLPGATSTSLCWRTTIEALSERFRTYALDAIYDAGRSVPSRPIKDAADLTGWLDEVFGEIGLSDNINLMGLSYSGNATAQYVLHAPQRLRKAVWLSPAMVVAPISLGFLLHLLPCVVPARAPLKSFTRWLMPDFAALDKRGFEELLDELYLARRCYGPMSMPSGRPVLSDAELGGIDVPVLFIIGDRDGVCDDPKRAVARLNEVAPRIETALIPDAGHDMIVSRADVVSDRILQFLEA